MKPVYFMVLEVTPPELIYDGEIGFQTQFANAGMWGRGIYFAVNASYTVKVAIHTRIMMEPTLCF